MVREREGEREREREREKVHDIIVMRTMQHTSEGSGK
jgi:hypothetical protein